MRLITILILATISLTTNAQNCELDRGKFHLTVFQLYSGNELLGIQDNETGDYEVLRVALGDVRIEDVQTDRFSSFLEIQYTDSQDVSQTAIFVKEYGRWNKLLSRKEEQQRLAGKGYDIDRPIPATRRRREP